MTDPHSNNGVQSSAQSYPSAGMSPTAAAALVKQCLDRLASDLTGGMPKTLASVTGSTATRELRDALQNALYHCQNPGQINSADPFWYPFKLACQPSQPHRMREVALDGLQKLIAYRLLRGSTSLASYVPLPPPASTSDANQNSVFQTFASITGLMSSVVTGRVSISGNPAADHDLSSLDASSPVAPSAPISNGRDSTILQNVATTARTSNVSRADSMGSTASLATNARGPQLPSNPYLIDEIIHTVCTSFNGFQSDTESSVQLQVLKVLLTAVTSTGCCEVHEISLLKVVQTCFNIHIHSRSSINSATAKATLTQMVNLIFSRMERYAEVLQQSIENGVDVSMFSALSPAKAGEDSAAVERASKESEIETIAAGPGGLFNAVSGSLQDVSLTPVSGVPPDLSEHTPSDSNEGIVRVINDDEETLDSEGINAAKDADDAVDEGEVAEAHEVTESPTSHTKEVPLVVGTAASTPEFALHQADETYLQRLPAVMSRRRSATTGGETIRRPVSSTITTSSETTAADGNNPYDPTVAYYNELLRKDAFLVFRLLCRLSVHSDSHGMSAQAFNAAAVREHADHELTQTSTKARMLALELVLSVLNNSGAVFLTDDLYVNLVRTNVCLSLSRNATATHPALFELSLSIFLMLIRFYRHALKPEIEVLLGTLFLHILEMTQSTYKQKSMVLQALNKICEDPQTLADLFLNYDCELACTSLFERIVSVCAKVASASSGVPGTGGTGGTGSTPGSSTPTTPPSSTTAGALLLITGYVDTKAELIRAQERRLKMRGLCCLVAVVNSLVQWSKDVAPGVKLPPGLPSMAGVRSNSRRISMSSTAIPPGSRRTSVAEDDARSVASEGVKAGEMSVAQRMPDRSRLANMSAENTAKSFLDALAPTNQNNPIMVVKHPLYSVLMSGASGPDKANGSHTSLLSTDDTAAGSSEQSSEIEKAATKKQILAQGIRLFTEKPNKGIKLLIDRGIIQDDPEHIAKFLRDTPGLSKSAIGDYIGENDPRNIRTMHAFMDSLEFAGLDFVSALRFLLQAFRLPGEAQKIDRIVEKFADRFCENNPGIFAKADVAYTLAFSVIMLNTDQHSRQIKHRMDKPAFIKNNRGINDNGDLPDAFLGAIFDEIQTREIIMEEEHAGQMAAMAIGWGAGDQNERIRMELYRREIAVIQKKSTAQLGKGNRASNIGAAGATFGSTAPGTSVSPFRSATNPELARVMFAVVSWSLMATFSLRFESAGVEEGEDLGGSPLAPGAGPAGASNEPKISDLCLQGFASAIHLAAIFRLETERDAFVSSLAALTGLQNLSRGLTPRAKNVKSIRVLLYLANSLGEYLDGSWVQVMRVVSLMERLHVTGRGAASTDGGRRSTELSRTSSDAPLSNWVFTAGGGAGGTIIRDTTPPLPSKAGHHAPSLDRVVAEFNSQQMVVAVDRIFSNTVQLSATAIIHFFRALCQVSLEEVGLEASALQLGGPSSVTTPITPVMPINVAASGSPGYSSMSQQALPAGVTGSAAGSGASQQPRMYLLQKIVEIAYYNMHRIRFEWSQIWRIIQPYFNAVASHPTNVQIATFGVDSLRQLTMKFLERDELAHYATQNDFLKSFETIMKMNHHVVIRELILSSLSQMITARANSIRSGWKSIFVALTRVTVTGSGYLSSGNKTVEGEDEVRLVKASFGIVQQIFREHFEVVVLGGAFVDFVNCLAEFALLEGHGQIHDEIVMGSIQLLQYCAKHLTQQALETHEGISDGKADHAVNEGEASNHTDAVNGPADGDGLDLPTTHSGGLISEENFFLKWFPILSAESRVIIESESLIVRTRALDALFETIRSAGHMFEIKYWRAIYRSIIFPIFEDLRDEPHRISGVELASSVPRAAHTNLLLQQQQAQQKASREATFAIWIQALRHMGDTVTHFFDFLSSAPTLLAQSSDGDVNEDHLVEQALRRRGSAASVGAESNLVRGVLELMVSMLQRKDEKLATTGEICLQQFLISNVHKFDQTGTWSLVTDIVVRAFAATLPAELLNCEYRSQGQVDEPPTENIIRAGLEAARAASAVDLYVDRSLRYEYREIGVESVGSPESQQRGEGSQYSLTLDTLDFEHVIVKCGTHLELIQTMRDVALVKLDQQVPTFAPSADATIEQSGPDDESRGRPRSLTYPPRAQRTSVLGSNVSKSALGGDPQTPVHKPKVLDLGSSNSLTSTTSASGNFYAIHAMPPADRARWFACLYDSYAVARAFNSNYDLRYAIWKRGLVQQMPNLVKQETIALATYLQLLFAVYPAQPKEVGHRLAAETSEVLERFSEFITDQQKNARDIALWSPVVVLVFREIMSLDWTSIQTPAVSQEKVGSEGVEEWSGLWIRREIPRFYNLGVKMMMVDRAEVRQSIQEFLVRVGQELILGPK